MYMNIYLSIYMFTLLKQKLLLAAVSVGGPRGPLGTLRRLAGVGTFARFQARVELLSYDSHNIFCMTLGYPGQNSQFQTPRRVRFGM